MVVRVTLRLKYIAINCICSEAEPNCFGAFNENFLQIKENYIFLHLLPEMILSDLFEFLLSMLLTLICS